MVGLLTEIHSLFGSSHLSGGDPLEWRKQLGGTFVCPFVTVEAPSGVTTGSNQMPKLRLRPVTLETWSQLNLASLKSLSTLAAGAVNVALFRSASPSCCIVSHSGREQPSFLRVRRSFAGLLHFLCVLGGSVVWVRRRLATSATLCCWWFRCGCRSRAHL